MPTVTGTLAAPRWAGDYLNRDSLIPGGARLDPAGFTADAEGRKHVPSGTPVGRTLVERDAGTGFGPAADTDDACRLALNTAERFADGLATREECRAAHAEAEALFRRALEVREERLGPAHTDVAQVLHNLAVALERQKNFNKAIKMYRKVLSLDANFKEAKSNLDHLQHMLKQSR